MVDAVVVVVVERAGEGGLGAFLAGDVVLLRCELRAPLCFGLLDFCPCSVISVMLESWMMRGRGYGLQAGDDFDFD